MKFHEPIHEYDWIEEGLIEALKAFRASISEERVSDWTEIRKFRRKKKKKNDGFLGSNMAERELSMANEAVSFGFPAGYL